MFYKFETEFSPDNPDADANLSDHKIAYTPLLDLLRRYGGKSFNHGIYRVLNPITVEYWNDVVGSAFPSFSGRITCFAIDWLGRCFAVDSARSEDGEPGVVLFEPGTGEALEVPCNILTFHDNELIQYRDAALAENYYKRWLMSGGASPSITQCIGYKKPFFLGGSDTIENLELSDLDVYWTIAAQLITKTKSIPFGTSLPHISIS